MKINFITNNKRVLIRLLVLIIVGILVYFCLRLKFIREIIEILFFSFIVSYSLKPLYKNMARLNINKRVSALLLITALIMSLTLGLIVIIPSILKEGVNLDFKFNEIVRYIEKINSRIKLLQNNKTMYVILDDVYGKLNGIITSLFSKIFNAALNFGENIISYAVIPIIVYYFLVDGENMWKKLITFFPLKSREVVKKITKDIDKILGRYIWSQIILCLIIGIATFFILIYLRIDFPIVLSLINAFFNIIPYFGPIFGAIPAIVIAFLKSPSTALYASIWLYLLQQIEGNIISPKITGDSVSMHPLSVIILLILGGKISGFLGMVLAVPIAVAVKVIYEDLNYYIF